MIHNQNGPKIIQCTLLCYPLLHTVEAMECEEEEPMESSNLPPSPSANTPHTPPTQHPCQLGLSLEASPAPLAQGGEAETVGVYRSPCSPQISLSAYNAQAGDYTQQALRDLKASPEYKKHTQRCHSCGASWYDGKWSQGCLECGEGALQVPCPVCKGRCGKVWRRNVEMSHSMSSAHWDGECGHKEAAAMIKDMLQLASVLDAMEDLQT